jgi:hypothetical protein
MFIEANPLATEWLTQGNLHGPVLCLGTKLGQRDDDDDDEDEDEKKDEYVSLTSVELKKLFESSNNDGIPMLERSMPTCVACVA